MNEDRILIYKSEYEALRKESLLLLKLFANGLEDWEGYEAAIKDFEDELDN